MANVLIAIPCFNRAALTKRTVESIRRTAGKEPWIACIDDRSTDETRDTLWRLLDSDTVNTIAGNAKPSGVAQSVNNGWHLHEWLDVGDIQFFCKIDNDIEFTEPGWLEHLVGILDAFPCVGIASLPIQPVKEKMRVIHAGEVRAKVPRSNLNGCCMVVARRCFDAIGYFYTGWPARYSYADAEYCYRAGVAGFTCAYADVPTGAWARHLQADDAAYGRWKASQREQNKREWASVRRGFETGTIPLRQEYRTDTIDSATAIG